MPLHRDFSPLPNQRILVWKIEEPESFFLKNESPKDAPTHAGNRLMWLAARHLVSLITNEEVHKDAFNKPFLPSGKFFISLSHTPGFAAAAFSTANEVGVDVETIHPKVERIAKKFLSADEFHIIQTSGLNLLTALTIAWSAKESVYKRYGRKQLDFRENMQLVKISKNAAQILFTKDCLQQIHSIGVEADNRNVLAWV